MKEIAAKMHEDNKDVPGYMPREEDMYRALKKPFFYYNPNMTK